MERLDQILEILGEQGEKLLDRLDDLKDNVVTKKDIFVANQDLEEMFALYGKKMILEKLDQIDTKSIDDDKEKRSFCFNLVNDLKEYEAEDIDELEIYSQYCFIRDAEKYLEYSKEYKEEADAESTIESKISDIINNIDFDPENVAEGIKQFKENIKNEFGDEIKVYDFTECDEECEENTKNLENENKKPEVNIEERVKVYNELYHNGDIDQETFMALVSSLFE